MSSRDVILQRIRQELMRARAEPQWGRPAMVAGAAQATLPPVPEVWPRENPPPTALAERFALELAAVHGETIRCASIEAARQQLLGLMEQAQWPLVGALDSPLAREITAGLLPDRLRWVGDDWPASRLAQLPAGLLSAECLLADTGSCLIECPTAVRRLMCYLPPACVVVARVEQIAEHLPAAWGQVTRWCADPSLRGEFVIVTGPSRTADIEKILILGVHGPKRLVVLLVG